jgi:cell division transport system permease protein
MPDPVDLMRQEEFAQSINVDAPLTEARLSMDGENPRPSSKKGGWLLLAVLVVGLIVAGLWYFKVPMPYGLFGGKQTVAEEDALKFKMDLDKEEYIRSSVYVSREQGQREMADLLGEDFLDVFTTSPIPISIDVTLAADYVSADSLEVVKTKLSASPFVEEVVYQRSLVDALNANLSRISLVISVLIALLLFISFVLINNTVRLNVFARRFTIHTMKLVGATRAFIRAPFLVQSAFQGVFAAFVSIIVLIGMMFFMRSEFAQLFEIFRLDLLLVVMGIVLFSGVAICLVSTWFVVNKLLSLSKDELYY